MSSSWMGEAWAGEAHMGITGDETGDPIPPPEEFASSQAGYLWMGDAQMGASDSDYSPHFVLSVYSVSATGNVAVVATGYGTSWTVSNPFSIVSGPGSGLTSYSNVDGTHASFNFTVTALTGRIVIKDTTTGFTRYIIADGLTFYISSAGSDANDGQTTGTPFQTIAGALAYMGGSWRRGGTINLNGGDTFTEAITVNDGVSGANASDLITFQSYGTGKAILSISQYGVDPVLIQDCGGVRVSNLDIRGAGPDTADSHQYGIRIQTLTPRDGTSLQNITITGNEVQNCMVGIGSDPEGMQLTPKRVTGTQITNNTVHDCWMSGIWFNNTEIHAKVDLDDAATLNHSNMTITGNHVYDIDGNSGIPVLGRQVLGILLGQCSNVLFSGKNVVHDVGATAGVNAALIVTIVCDGITIRGNEFYNVFGTADGSGIDIDHGSSNCVVEHNYVHDCEGAGLIAFEFTTSTRPAYATREWTNNVFRYNVVQNCNDHASSPWGDFSIVGDDLENCFVYNNTFAHIAGGGNCLVLAYGTTTNISGFKFYNNIFLGSSSAVKLIEIPSGFTGVSAADFEFKNNIFYTNSGNENIEYPSGNYTSISAWESANASTVSGNIHADPLLSDPFTAVTFDDATQIRTLTKVTPSSSSSPAVNAGLNLTAAPYSYTGITKDFKQALVPIGAFDIGAVEFQGTAGVARSKTRGLAGAPVIGSLVG